jgi:hypothetical protein
MIDINRNSNLVDNATWIRNQMCSGTNLLLRSLESNGAKTILCSLNDESLESFFTFISSELDYTKVKNRVFLSTIDFEFSIDAANALNALIELKKVIL